jgi:hypothetical protein
VTDGLGFVPFSNGVHSTRKYNAGRSFRVWSVTAPCRPGTPNSSSYRRLGFTEISRDGVPPEVRIRMAAEP